MQLFCESWGGWESLQGSHLLLFSNISGENELAKAKTYITTMKEKFSEKLKKAETIESGILRKVHELWQEGVRISISL